MRYYLFIIDDVTHCEHEHERERNGSACAHLSVTIDAFRPFNVVQPSQGDALITRSERKEKIAEQRTKRIQLKSNLH